MHQQPSRGVDPGTYGGIERDLLTFVANFWHGTGALNCSCTCEARYSRDFKHPCHLENDRSGPQELGIWSCIVNTGRSK